MHVFLLTIALIGFAVLYGALLYCFCKTQLLLFKSLFISLVLVKVFECMSSIKIKSIFSPPWVPLIPHFHSFIDIYFFDLQLLKYSRTRLYRIWDITNLYRTVFPLICLNKRWDRTNPSYIIHFCFPYLHFNYDTPGQTGFSLQSHFEYFCLKSVFPQCFTSTSHNASISRVSEVSKIVSTFFMMSETR